MEKITLEFSKKSDIVLSYFGKNIVLNQTIRLAEQSTLRNVYVESLFKKGINEEWDEQFAEFMFRREIINLKTDIDIYSLSIDFVDELIWGEFYDKVSSNIINYKEVKESISKTVSNIITKFEIENGSGYLIKGIIEKVKPLLDEVLNMKPEDFEKLKSSAVEMFDKIKQEPVASVLADMGGNKQPKKKSVKKDKEYVQ